MALNLATLPTEHVDSRILWIREQKIILDTDLAIMYGVNTKALNQAVKRNSERFPVDFMFQLTADEKSEVVTMCDHLKKLKFSPVLPYAFTEHGAIMVASVLNSPHAVQASVFVVRAFIKMREVLSTHKALAQKLEELETRLENHDEVIRDLVLTIRDLAEPLQKIRKARIGFKPSNPKK